MSNEELEQDELEMQDDEEGGQELSAAEAEELDEDELAADAPSERPAKKTKVIEPEELPSVEAKQRERDELARAMEEFLARGGQVQEIDDNVVTDPPKKPESKYGSRPI